MTEASAQNRLLFILPALFVLCLLALFALMLTADRNPQEIKNIQVGRQIPAISLPLLTGDTLPAFDDGKMTLINFFASWCVPCRAEHAQLMELAERQNLRVIGIAYKDKRDASLDFLDELGNPFAASVSDIDGLTAIDFGVTGVPESFLVDGNGVIRHHVWGPLVASAYSQDLLPKIDQLGREMGLGAESKPGTAP